MKGWKLLWFAAAVLVSATFATVAAPQHTTILFEIAPGSLHELGVRLFESSSRTDADGIHHARLALEVEAFEVEAPGALEPTDVAVLKLDIDVWGPGGDFLGRFSQSPVISFGAFGFSLDVLLFDSRILPAFQRGSTIRFRITSGFTLPGVAADDPWLDGYEPRCPGSSSPPASRCKAIRAWFHDQLERLPNCNLVYWYLYCGAADLHPVEQGCHYPDVFANWDYECG